MIKSIGIFDKSEFWEIFLLQSGIPYIPEIGYSERSDSNIGAIIFNRKIGKSEIDELRRFWGEEVIFIFTHIYGKKKREIKENEQYSFRNEIYYFDILIEEYEYKNATDQKEVYFPIKFILPAIGKIERKNFYHSRNELASERVSKTKYGEILRFIQNFLVTSFKEHNQDIEHIIPLPENKPVFIFRIDTDFADYYEIVSLFKICQKHNISGSWFTDVHSDKNLSLYKEEFQDHEIGLHCDKHYVYGSKEQNLSNIKRGIELLRKHSLEPFGFAAPFGNWTMELESALFECNFSYSSEFCFAYDTLPFVRKFKEKKMLQVPIHPISPGRLRRAHYNLSEMRDYYRQVMNSCLEKQIPLIIYHHPAHGLLELIDQIFKMIRDNRFNNITMISYASWWLKRYEFLQCNANIELMSSQILEKKSIIYPEDYRNCYKKNWRWYQAEYESWKGQKYFKKYGYPRRAMEKSL